MKYYSRAFVYYYACLILSVSTYSWSQVPVSVDDFKKAFTDKTANNCSLDLDLKTHRVTISKESLEVSVLNKLNQSKRTFDFAHAEYHLKNVVECLDNQDSNRKCMTNTLYMLESLGILKKENQGVQCAITLLDEFKVLLQRSKLDLSPYKLTVTDNIPIADTGYSGTSGTLIPSEQWEDPFEEYSVDLILMILPAEEALFWLSTKALRVSTPFVLKFIKNSRYTVKPIAEVVENLISKGITKTFRADSRAPAKLFQAGKTFVAKGDESYHFFKDVVGEDINRFVSTTVSQRRAEEVVFDLGEEGYVYEININRARNAYHFDYDQIVYVDEIPLADIVGAYSVKNVDDVLIKGEFIPNPYFLP